MSALQATNQIAFSAPHYTASQAGIAILEAGGTAIEATIAAAASLSVVYPHMTGLGGDGFWLISEPGKSPIAIDACGSAGNNVDLGLFNGYSQFPERGGLACSTMAGAVAGWQKALSISRSWQKPIPLEELFAAAIGQARWGIEVSSSLANASVKSFSALSKNNDFVAFTHNGSPLQLGKNLKLTAMAQTLEQLAKSGLMDFYRGDVAKTLQTDLNNNESPLRQEDFLNYSAQTIDILNTTTSKGTFYNLSAPTQGIASLIILALFDRLESRASDEADVIHLLLEATKIAYEIREKLFHQLGENELKFSDYLTDDVLDELAGKIDINQAKAWPDKTKKGDTVWTGAIDQDGRMVSYIQSLYWEFGSGVTSPSTGIIWNNRSSAFSLDQSSLNCIAAGKKPFHTLNPAYAELNDGRRICYGSMGGEGQPQFQAALLVRYLYQGLSLKNSVTKGRWLIGKTWGNTNSGLSIESDLEQKILDGLAQRGHDLNLISPCNELMGHAGLVELRPDAQTLACSDPRSDGRSFASLANG